MVTYSHAHWFGLGLQPVAGIGQTRVHVGSAACLVVNIHHLQGGEMNFKPYTGVQSTTVRLTLPVLGSSLFSQPSGSLQSVRAKLFTTSTS